ncbi:MAG: hypothetical protein GY838_01570 [bacterium]|nr:hypothetical protein [bacterium]
MSVPSPRLTRAAGPILLLAVAAAALAAAWWRPIDGDEGYYAAAAGLVAQGQTPYTDFFYPQAPLLPALYAPVVKAAGPGLRPLRGLSAILLVATAVIWWRYLACRYRQALWLVVLGTAYVALQPHVLSWSVTVKTYALTGLLVTVAWMSLAGGLAGRRRILALAGAGLALGLAGSVRLLFAPLGPVVVLALAVTGRRVGERPGQWLRDAALVAGGWALGSLPLLVCYLRDPAAFVFDNLRYHEIRFSELRNRYPEPGLARRAAASLAGLAGILVRDPFQLVQFALIGAGAWLARRTGGAEGRFLAVVGAATLVYVLFCLAPDPVYAQYFGAPLASLALPLIMVTLLHLGGTRWERRAVVAGALVVLGAGVFFVGRPGMDDDPAWSFENYHAVAAEIRSHSEQDDVVFSLWPGYVFESGRRFVPGMENHFAIGVSAGLGGADRTLFRIPNHRSVTAALKTRTPRMAVFGTWTHEIDLALDNPQMGLLLGTVQENYEVVKEFGSTSVWVVKRAP